MVRTSDLQVNSLALYLLSYEGRREFLKNCKGKYNLFCLFDGVEYYPLIPLREKLIGDIAQRNEDRKKVKEIVEMMDELIYDEDEDEDDE